eukprot:6466720-Amphidinium_carterae.1
MLVDFEFISAVGKLAQPVDGDLASFYTSLCLWTSESCTKIAVIKDHVAQRGIEWSFQKQTETHAR